MTRGRILLWAAVTWSAAAALALYLRRRGARKRQVTITQTSTFGIGKGDIIHIGAVHFEAGEVSGRFVVTRVVDRNSITVRPADRIDRLIWWLKHPHFVRKFKTAVLVVRLSLVWSWRRFWDMLREIWRH